MNNNNKWVNVLVLTLVMGIMLLGAVSAADVSINPFADRKIVEPTITTDMSDFIKSDFNTDYGVIRLSKTFFWFETDKIAEYSLTKNTEYCILNCEAEGKVTLFSDGILFDDVKFKTLKGQDTSIINSEYLIFDGYKDNYVDVPDTYKKVCKLNNQSEEVCSNVVETYKKENQPIENWVKYGNEILKAGDYKWKIKGVKNAGDTIDFIPIRYDKEFSEWAVWTSGFDYGLFAYYNFSDANDQVNGYNLNVQALTTPEYIANASTKSGLGKAGFVAEDGEGWSINDSNQLDFVDNNYEGTIAYWIKYDKDSGEGYVLKKPLTFWSFFNSATTYYQGTGFGAQIGPFTTASKNWYLMVHIRNSTHTCMFINGTATDPKCAARVERAANTDNMLLFNMEGSYFQGYIDEMGMWNRSLTETEINDLYNGGLGLSRDSMTAPDTPPTIALTSPANETTFNTISVELKCTGKDDRIVENVSLYIDGAINYTLVDGVTNLTELTKTQNFLDGTYNWNCKVSDNATTTQTAIAPARTFYIETTPNITYINPTLPNDTTQSSNSFLVNVSVTENYFHNLTFYLYKDNVFTSKDVYTNTQRWNNFSSLADGTYQYNVTIWTTTGQFNSTITQTININTTPNITYISPTLANDTTQSSNSFLINVSVTEDYFDNVTFYLYKDDDTFQSKDVYTNTKRWNNFSSLSDGIYRYNVTIRTTTGQSNSTITQTIAINSTPNITYISPTPINYFNQTTDSFVVNVSLTETYFKNVTFYLFNSAGTILTKQAYTDNTRQHNFSGLTDDEYMYNVTTWTTTGQKNYTATRNLTRHTVAPTFVLNALANVTTRTLPVNAVLDITTTDPYLSVCEYSTSDTATRTVYVCNAPENIPFATDGQKNVTVYANDTFGNSANVTYPVRIFNILESGIGTPTTIIEGDTAYYTLYVNTTSIDNLNVNAWLNFNGTEYSYDNKVVSTNYVMFNKTLTVPSLPGALNAIKNWTWFYNVSNGGVTPIATKWNVTGEQNYSQFLFGNCNSTLTKKVLNITFKDETTGLFMNATMDDSTWTYRGKTISFINVSVHNYEYDFCMYPAYVASFAINDTLKYSHSESATYPTRQMAFNEVLTNTTITHHILYLLNSLNGISSTYQVITIGNQVISGARIQVTRSIAGLTVTVADGYTDSAGLVTFFLNPNFLHTYTVSATGYSSQTQSLTPTGTAYTFTMGGGSSYFGYTGSMEGVSYVIWPPSGLVTSGVYNFSLTVNSNTSKIYNCSFNIRYDNYTLINSSHGCNSVYPALGTGGVISKMINVTGINKLYGEFYVTLTNNTIYKLEGDARWVLVPISNHSSLGLKYFFQDLTNMTEWGDNPQTTDFSRIVFFFLFCAIILGALNAFTGYDAAYPGAFIYLLFFIVLIMTGSSGLEGPGFFYLEGATNHAFGETLGNIMDNWIVAFFFGLIATIYFFVTNRRYQG